MAAMEPVQIGRGDLERARVSGCFEHAAMEPVQIGRGDGHRTHGTVLADVAAMEPVQIGRGDRPCRRPASPAQ